MKFTMAFLLATIGFTSAHAEYTTLATGKLAWNGHDQQSAVLNVEAYKTVFVGIKSGSVDCQQSGLQLPVIPTKVMAFFGLNDPATLYVQKNCGIGNEICWASTRPASSILAPRVGTFFQIQLHPEPFGSGTIRCQGVLTYEILGEK